MKKIISQIITILLVIISFANAQVNTKKEVDLVSIKFTPNTISYVDKNELKKETVVTFLDSNKLYVVALTNEFTKTSDSLFYKFPNGGYTINNTLFNKNGISYLVSNSKGNKSVLQYEYKTKKWTLGSNLLRDGEHFLCAIKYQDKFIIFNYDRTNLLVKTYEASVNGSTLFHEFNMSNFKLGDNDFDYFFKKKKKALKLIHSGSENELFASIKPKKAYHFNDKVYFSIEDSSTQSVGLIQLNLKTKKQSFSYFKAEKTSCADKQFINAALTANHLALFSGCLGQATLSIWDLNSNKLIKSQVVSKDELIQFKSFDNLISPKQALSIEKLKPIVLLQQFMTKNASVYLKEENGSLVILVGYSKIKNKKAKVRQNKGGGGGNRNGGGNGTGGGKQRKMLKEKQRQIKGYGISKSYLNYEVHRPQYFVAQLNLETNQFDTNTIYVNSFEQLKRLKGSLNKKLLPGYQLVINDSKSLWLGYIDREAHKLYFIKE